VTAATKDHTNVGWVRGSSDADDIARLAKLRSLGMGAVLDLQRVFFKSQEEPLCGANVSVLQSDASQFTTAEIQSRWSSYRSQIASFIATNTVTAFHPIDEPYQASRASNQPCAAVAVRNYWTYHQMLTRLNEIANIIRATDPGAMIALTLKMTELNWMDEPGSNTANLNLLPASFKWVGYDCYGSWSNCDGKSIPAALAQIKRKMTLNQKLYFFGDSNVKQSRICSSLTADTPIPGVPIDESVARMQAYNGYASLEPRLIGLFSFIYQNVDEGGECFFGAGAVPKLKQINERIGRPISRK
jgi:hypothetical protein